MEGLWTNRNSLSDFVRNGLYQYAEDVSSVYVAVAFFTKSEFIKNLTRASCRVRLVVRLEFPTCPKALSEIMNNDDIEIRYYSDRTFHPKLYIFGDRAAVVGSANLTDNALSTNQEVMVSVESEDPRFNELASLFNDYWNEAQVLTPKDLNIYRAAYERYDKPIWENISSFNKEIKSKIGESTFSNINRGKKQKPKKIIFLDDFRRTYQESVKAFKNIKSVYEAKKRRKNGNSKIPIRLEIDSFFSFVRETHATDEKWKTVRVGWSTERQQVLSDHIEEWFNTEWPHFDKEICDQNYPKINSILETEDSIENASYNELTDALVVLHSFHDRLRFYPGGLETLLKKFKSENELDQVKSSIKHLLYGKGDIIKRMADLIYDNSFKLEEFGRSNVQELVGWMNREELPVINGRTTKVLRYYGFEVRQL